MNKIYFTQETCGFYTFKTADKKMNYACIAEDLAEACIKFLSRYAKWDFDTLCEKTENAEFGDGCEIDDWKFIEITQAFDFAIDKINDAVRQIKNEIQNIKDDIISGFAPPESSVPFQHGLEYALCALEQQIRELKGVNE